MRSYSAFVSVLVFGLCGSTRAQWEFTTPVTTNEVVLSAVAAGTNGVFTAIGTNNDSLSLTFNGNHVVPVLTHPSLPTSLRAITFGDGFFLAAGTMATQYYSSDGINWVQSADPVFTNFTTVRGLAYNPVNGRFAAVGGAAIISYMINSPIWLRASNLNSFFFEAYRDVTPRGPNGFAAAGILGLIRGSSDGGQGWVINRPMVLTGGQPEPDLLGIASDDPGVLLVAVGGTNILYSSDSGQTWQHGSSYDATKAYVDVAYTGSGFVAVSTDGTVVSSGDGSNWTTINNAGFPLAAVTFAREGSLTNVGLFVGQSGQWFLAGTRPPAPAGPMSATNCSYLPANSTLAVSVPDQAIHTVDWYTASEMLVATNTLTYTPTNQEPGTYVYRTRIRDKRTQFLSTSHTEVTLTLDPRPTALVTGSTTICNGETTELQAALTGEAPWVVTWSDGYIQTNTTSPARHNVTPFNPHPDTPLVTNVFVVTLTDANCEARPSDLSGPPAIVVVNPRPTAVAVGTSTICSGQPALLRVGLSGMGPWTITWADGFVQTTNGRPATRIVSPVNSLPDAPTNYTYTISAVSDANCFARPTDITGAPVITVNPRPKAVASGTTTICNGASTTLQAALNGIGPWTVTWSDGLVQTTNGRPAVRVVAPPNTLADAATNYTFTVTAVTDANCVAQPGDISGSAMITVNPRPKAVASGTTTICNGASTTLQAALNGLGPWTVTWSDGLVQTTNGRPAVRVVAPPNTLADAATNYTFTVTAVTDANCVAQPGDISGSAMITVNPRPKAVASGTTTICNGASTTLQAALNGLGPWTVTWSDGLVQTTNGRPALRVVSPVNPLLNASTNATYSVTAVADANCAAQPSDISGSVLITVNPRPKAVASGTTTICNGGSTTLQAALTGLGPWTVTWSDGVVQTTNGQPAVRTISPANPLPNAATNILYAVTALADANCVANAGDLTGTATITVNPRPTALVSSTNSVCDGQLAVVQADLTGIGPWMITWNDGTISNVVTSPALKTVSVTSTNANEPTTAFFTITALSNATTCVSTPADISGGALITVNPRLKAQVSGTNTLCDGESTVITADLTGIGPWEITWSDGTVSNVVQSPALKTVTPAATNTSGPTVVFYTITALSNAISCVNAPGDIAGGAEITINRRPTAALTATFNGVCAGGNAVLMADLTGTPPWTVQWSDGFTDTNVLVSPAVRNITVTNAGTVALTNFLSITGMADRDCAAVSIGLTGTAVVVAYPRPAVPVVSGPLTNCVGTTNPVFTATVDAGQTADWYDGTGTNLLATNVLTYVPTNTAAGIYSFGVIARDPQTMCVSTNSAQATLVLQDCAAKPLLISLLGTNVVLRWVGDFELQSTALLTNAPSTNVWLTLTNGTAGATNYWTNGIIGSQSFFRLYAPTN